MSTCLLAVLLAFGVAISLAGCGLGANETQGDPERPRAVRVVSPKKGEILRQLEYVGTVRAQRDVQVLARTSATAVQILVDEGDIVRVGQALIRMSAPDLDAQVQRLQAELERARTDRDYLCRTDEKDRALADAGALPFAQADASHSRCLASKEGFLAARAAMSEARERHRRLQEVAPAAGIVLQRTVEPGEYVSPGRPLFLVGAGDLELRVPVSEHDIQAGLMAGGAAIVATPHEKTRTTIQRIAPMAKGPGRTVEVRLGLPEVLRDVLRPGMSVNVAFVLAENLEAMTLPEEAILQTSEGAFVFVVVDSRLKKIPIETGIRAEGRVEVRQAALLADAQVVLGGVSGGSDGVLVYPVQAQPQAKK